MMRTIIKHRVITGLFAAAFAFVVGGFVWALVAIDMRTSGGTGGAIGSIRRIILHFNDIDGITRIGGIENLWYAGVFAMIAVGINYAIALELDVRDRIMGKIMAAVTLVAAILLFIACTAILSVN